MFEKCKKMNLINMSVLSLSVLGMANVFAEDAREMEGTGIQQDSSMPAEVSADVETLRSMADAAGIFISPESIKRMLELHPEVLDAADSVGQGGDLVMNSAAQFFPARFEVDGQATIYQDTLLTTKYAGGRFSSTGINVLLNYSAVLGGTSYENMAFYGSSHNGDVEAKLAVNAEFDAYGVYGRADLPGPFFPNVAYGVYGTTNHMNGYGVYAGNTAAAGDFQTTGGGTALYATGSINGGYTAGGLHHIDNHVAIIENTVANGYNAHVLALSIPNDTNPSPFDNFVTFYAGGLTSGDAVGAIEGNSSNGVSYTSGSADFAEWMPRLHSDEVIEAGDIVGLGNGKVSRNLHEFDHIKVISTAPAFAGNDPGFDKRDQYALVAMMGQVPVKVAGVVNAGDYIVASGKNDGEGIAIAADKMTPDDYRMAVGHAWESSTGQGVKLINTAIGLGANDSYAYMRKQDQRIASLERQLSGKMEKLDRLATQMEALTRRVAYIQANEVIASASIEE